MALGGILGALAVVVMSMGGLIPVATFICPMICMILLSTVNRRCGRRTAWAWYGAVSLLSLLLGPDKEAAAVFLFLGYYPILKPAIDRSKAAVLLKLTLFNGAILTMYALLVHLFGMDQIGEEYRELGALLTVIMLLLGNITFVLLDVVLSRLKL